MPRILSHTPAWLSEAASRFKLFSENAATNHAENRNAELGKHGKTSSSCPRRVIASRGSEVFVATGKTIKWADLASWKSAWESKAAPRYQNGKRQTSVEPDDESQDGPSYKVLKLQYVHEPIQQLIPSPDEGLIAVVTEHTIHVCVLPDLARSGKADAEPIQPKAQIIGPTTHVVSQSRIVKALWHPLALNSTCLVTVTEDAVVRLWEIDMANRWSPENPALAIDLRKLQSACSSEDDVEPARLGTNRGYSTDAFGMEVSSACFGGTGSEEEQGWASLTLWIAMTEGDVYALCPLIPPKWAPPASLIPSLTLRIAAKRSSLRDSTVPVSEHELCEQQYAWILEIDKDEPVMVEGKTEFSPQVPVYSSLPVVGLVPKLQGPFAIVAGEIEEDLDIADVSAIAPSINIDGTFSSDNDFDILPSNPFSTSVVCLLTGNGRIHVCLSLDGVEGQWLSKSSSSRQSVEDTEDSLQLVVLESLDTIAEIKAGIHFDLPPTITADIHSRSAIFVTHQRGVVYLSLAPLLEQLEKEFEADSSSGTKLRFEGVMKGSHVLREKLLDFRSGDASDLSAPVVMQDSDLGYFLMTFSGGNPHAARLDTPRNLPVSSRGAKDSGPTIEEIVQRDFVGIDRPVYQPPESLYQPSSLRSFADTYAKTQLLQKTKDEVRLSPATLVFMTEVHRELGREVQPILVGAAKLFEQCTRMRHELKNQLESVREIITKVDHINGDDYDDDDGNRSQVPNSEPIEERLERIRKTHENILRKHESVKQRLRKAGGRPLSEKEQAWVKEVDRLSVGILDPRDYDGPDTDESNPEYLSRFEEAKELTRDLVEQSKVITETKKEEDNRRSSSFRVPPDIRKNKVANVMSLLDRECALVDAAQERIERLTLGG